MRHYQGVDVSRVKDAVTREHLRTMDRALRDMEAHLATLSVSTGSSSVGAGAARDDEAYVVTTASSDLSNEKVLTTTSPITGTVGAGTVTLAAPTAVTSAASLTDDAILVGAGGAQGCETRAVKIDSSSLYIRESSGEWQAVLASSSKTSPTSFSDTTTETTLASEVLKSGIINEVGRNVRLRAYGLVGTAAVGVGDFTFRVKYGSTTVASGTFTMADNLTDKLWILECDITTITTGAPGTVEAQGAATFVFSSGGSTNVILALLNTGTVSVDTTGAVTVSITGQFVSSADPDNICSCRLFQADVGGRV